MNEPDRQLAQISSTPQGWQAIFSRAINYPAPVVWQALTDPAILPQWLAPGTLELKLGGRARLDFIDSGTVIDSAISAFEAGSLLEYSWSQPGDPLRPVRWCVTPDGAGCRLELTLGVPAGEDVARSCAGWEAHLDMLDSTLEGVSIKFPFETFMAARQQYKALLEG